jgi:hypothetical protein
MNVKRVAVQSVNQVDIALWFFLYDELFTPLLAKRELQL